MQTTLITPTTQTALAELLAQHRPSDMHNSVQRLLKFFMQHANVCEAELIGSTKKTGSRKIKLAELLNGWHVLCRHVPDTIFTSEEFINNQKIYFELAMQYGGLDPLTYSAIQGAGKTRTVLRSDIIDDGGWNQHWITHDYIGTLGFSDRMLAVCTLDDQTEVYFVFSRKLGQPAYTQDDAKTIKQLLPFTQPLCQHLMLQYGALPHHANILAPNETELVAYLLQGHKEAAIAEALQRSRSSVHTAITRLFRKYHVSGRAELTALWL